MMTQEEKNHKEVLIKAMKHSKERKNREAYLVYEDENIFIGKLIHHTPMQTSVNYISTVHRSAGFINVTKYLDFDLDTGEEIFHIEHSIRSGGTSTNDTEKVMKVMQITCQNAQVVAKKLKFEKDLAYKK